MKNKNLYALVTGGTRGIGRHLAEVLAQEGYNLVVIARNAADLEILSRDIRSRFSVKVLTIEADLSNADDAFIIHRDIKAQNIEIAVLANNVAGQGNFQAFIDTDLQRHTEIIQFNIINFIVLARLFLPEMVERGRGKIISLAAGEKVDHPLPSVYLASVAFLDSFMSSIASELEGTGLTVTNIRSENSGDNIFGNSQKRKSTNVARPPMEDDKTHSGRDGYGSFMRGD